MTAAASNRTGGSDAPPLPLAGEGWGEGAGGTAVAVSAVRTSGAGLAGFAASAAPASAAPASAAPAPSASIIATTLPSDTASPTLTLSSRITPANGAGTSIV